MSYSSDALVLLSSITSKMSVLSKSSIYNIQTFIQNILYRIYPYMRLFFFFINNILNEYYNIMENQFFPIVKEFYESILIFAKL